MFLVFRFLRFLCKFVILRTRGGNKEWFFHHFFCIHPHYVTMTKIESRDFALIFSGKRPFNTLSKMELSDIVIVTMDFYLHSAQEMLIWNSQCLTKLTIHQRGSLQWFWTILPYLQQCSRLIAGISFEMFLINLIYKSKNLEEEGSNTCVLKWWGRRTDFVL